LKLYSLISQKTISINRRGVEQADKPSIRIMGQLPMRNVSDMFRLDSGDNTNYTSY